MTFIFSQGSAGLIRTGLYMLAQNTLFLAAVFGLLRLLRKAPASLKYTVGMAALVKLLVPPVFSISFESGLMSRVSALFYQAPPVYVYPGQGREFFPQAGTIILLLWAMTAAAILLFHIGSHILFMLRIRRSSLKPVSVPADALGARIRASDAVVLPLTAGYIHKTIYVPEAWHSWSDERKTYILKHEQAHILRKDGLLTLVQIVIQSVYFFHPLVWMLSRRVSAYREMACDDMASGGAIDARIEYSRILVDIVETMVPSHTAVLSTSALIRQKGELLQRVTYLVKEDHMKDNLKKHRLAALALLGIAVVAFSWQCTQKQDAQTAESVNLEEAAVSTEPPPPPPPPPADEKPEFVAYDQPPVPEGGFAAIQKNVRYPEIAKKAGIEGQVVIKAHIAADGSVTETKVAKDIGDGKNGCAEAAVNAIKSVTWKPAQNKGENVAVWVSVPIVFKLK